MNPRRGGQRGQELVEYALAFPLFLLLVMSIVDLGRATYYYSSLHYLAREGARYAIVYPADLGGTETAVRSRAVGLDPTILTVSTDFPTDDSVQVTVTYEFAAITPVVGALLGSNVLSIGSRSTMSIEG